MKTIYAIIAILLFSLILYNNFGCKISTDPTSPSVSNYNGWVISPLNISGIVTDRNNNPVDTATVEIWGPGIEKWSWIRLDYRQTNERGEYSFNTKITTKGPGVPQLDIWAVDYTINDSGETERWYSEADWIEMKESPQVINLQITHLDTMHINFRW